MSELASFLSEAYYAVGITVVCVGLVVWLANLQSSVKAETEAREKWEKIEVESRRGAINAALENIIRVEKVSAMDVNKLYMRLDDIESKGTRAMSERVSLMMQQLKQISDRNEELYKMVFDLQKDLHKTEATAMRLSDRVGDMKKDIDRCQQEHNHPRRT